jgi:hypothetical protein
VTEHYLRGVIEVAATFVLMVGLWCWLFSLVF